MLTTAAASSTYHVACTSTLSSGLLLLYQRRTRSPSPSRRWSRLSNCLSCSDSSLFNALPSLETPLDLPPRRDLTLLSDPSLPLRSYILARQEASLEYGPGGAGKPPGPGPRSVRMIGEQCCMQALRSRHRGALMRSVSVMRSLVGGLAFAAPTVAWLLLSGGS